MMDSSTNGNPIRKEKSNIFHVTFKLTNEKRTEEGFFLFILKKEQQENAGVQETRSGHRSVLKREVNILKMKRWLDLWGKDSRTNLDCFSSWKINTAEVVWDKTDTNKEMERRKREKRKNKMKGKEDVFVNCSSELLIKYLQLLFKTSPHQAYSFARERKLMHIKSLKRNNKKKSMIATDYKTTEKC